VVADSRRYPGLGWFLLANFLLLDAVHTVIVFMSVYAEKVMGLPDTAKVQFFMVATVPAIFGSLAAGYLSDRFGPRRVFAITAWLWVLLPVVVVVTTETWVFYTVGGCIGVLLGSLWSTTRPLLLSLIPPDEEGRAFGVYAFCNKSAAVLGPQIWAVTVLLAAPLGEDRYRLAILVLSGVAASGALLLGKVPRR
jgi:UMF1 family MFS transporter